MLGVLLMQEPLTGRDAQERSWSMQGRAHRWKISKGVADEFPTSLGKRYALLKETVLGLELEPFPCTPAEWREMLRSPSCVLQVRLCAKRNK